MVEDAKFWVVEPRVTLSGVSGFGTLLSGNYIGFELGTSDKKQRKFTGLEVAPIITGGKRAGSSCSRRATWAPWGLARRSTTTACRWARSSHTTCERRQGVEIKIFVNAPYDQYVNPGTRFWNASGIDVSIGAGGVDVRTQSLIALLAGGLAFNTPSFAAKAEPAAANTVFTLYTDQTTAMKQPESISTRYVLHFNESLRGLSVGAPVTFFGLPVGEVTEVGLRLIR